MAIVPAERSSIVDIKQAANDDIVETDSRQVETAQLSPWKPGFRSQFPWLGFGALGATILLSILSIVVLITSNGQGVSNWPKKIAPNVLLSMLNGASSLCIAIAVTQGMAVAWWRQALHGTTVKELQHSWSFSTSLSSIFLHPKHFNLVALAALAAKLTIVDGVLFQRSTTTELRLSKSASPISITTFPTRSFPQTGAYNSAANDTRILLSWFIDDVSTWTLSPWGSIYSIYGFDDCTGVCFVQVPAIGFVAECENTTTKVDFAGNAIAQAQKGNTSIEDSHDIFGVNFTYHWATPQKNYSWIELNTLSYTTETPDYNNDSQICPAILMRQDCELRPALISYPVTMQNTVVASTTEHESNSSYVAVYLGQLDMTTGQYKEIDYSSFDRFSRQIPGFKFLEYINMTGQPAPDARTNVGGIVYALTNHFTSKASVNITANSTASLFYSQSEGEFAAVAENIDDNAPNIHSCPFSFENPITRIMVDLNSLMFITSEDPYNRANYTNAKNMTESQADAYYDNSIDYVQGIEFKDEIHYKSVYGYMFGALAATIFCVLCVLTSYWGFWELGRKVTLSPIEISNAFQAPVLYPGVGLGHADDVVKVAGQEKVRYAGFDNADSSGKNFRFDRAAA